MTSPREQEEIRLEESIKNTRKLILIENLDELNLKGRRKRDFIRFYYNNLNMNLLQALDEFKKL